MQSVVTAAPDRCTQCQLSATLCLCAYIEAQPSRLQVVILQHPQERHVAVGSAALALRCLPNSRLRVGLSWPSLQAVVGTAPPPGSWLVLFPATRQATAAPTQPAPIPSAAAPPRGIIVLDGSWSQAKTLWWRNPWLLKCPRLSLSPTEPSIYGKLRRQPQPHCLATLEAIAEALVELGEPAALRLHLRRMFRMFVQRQRDAQRPAPTRLVRAAHL